MVDSHHTGEFLIHHLTSCIIHTVNCYTHPLHQLPGCVVLPGSRKLRPHSGGHLEWGGGSSSAADDPAWHGPCQQGSCLQNTEGKPHLFSIPFPLFLYISLPPTTLPTSFLPFLSLLQCSCLMNIHEVSCQVVYSGTRLFYEHVLPCTSFW